MLVFPFLELNRVEIFILINSTSVVPSSEKSFQCVDDDDAQVGHLARRVKERHGNSATATLGSTIRQHLGLQRPVENMVAPWPEPVWKHLYGKPTQQPHVLTLGRGSSPAQDRIQSLDTYNYSSPCIDLGLHIEMFLGAGDPQRSACLLYSHITARPTCVSRG